MNKEQIKEALKFIAYTIIGIGMFCVLYLISEIFSV